MATVVAIAQMRDDALRRLNDATRAVSERLNIAPADLPEFNRDPDYLHAAQLTALADWAERLADSKHIEAVTRSSEVGSREGNVHVSKTQNPKSRR